MRLIGSFEDPGYLALADVAMAFFDRRIDLQRSGLAFSFGTDGEAGDAGEDRQPGKVSTDMPPQYPWWKD